MIIVKPKGMIIKGEYHRPGSGTVVLARQARKQICCPECGEHRRLRKKSKVERTVPHIQILDESVFIRWEGHKYHCRSCGRYFNERFPGLLPRRRFTETFRKEVFNLHQKGVSQKDLSRLKGIGSATVERWFHHLLARKNKEYDSYRYPKQLGIDEHRFSRKVGFSTTLCDLNKHRILDVIKGKSAREIIPKLKRIPGRESVEMINIDLCDTYRSIAKEVFPNARLVTDRFHVIRLVNHHFLNTWKTLDPESKYSRGLLSLMRRHHWRLSPDQKLKLYEYMHAKCPALIPIYELKQSLNRLLLIKSQTKRECRHLVPKLLQVIQTLKKAHFEHLVTLGNTLDSWKEEIACMWRFTKTNSITEGFHRKMKLIQRRAYGFKNFDNYRLRVRVLCGSMNLNSILT